MPYIGKTTDGFGVRNRFVYLASASDTSVSGADANGATLTFTDGAYVCLLYTSPSPRDLSTSRMPSSA